MENHGAPVLFDFAVQSGKRHAGLHPSEEFEDKPYLQIIMFIHLKFNALLIRYLYVCDLVSVCVDCLCDMLHSDICSNVCVHVRAFNDMHAYLRTSSEKYDNFVL